jgi:cell division protein FtsL
LRQTVENEEILVRYLLGDLTEEEQESIEERYFGDRDFFEQLLVIEDELIDSYIGKRLSGAQRDQFEKYFLRSHDRQERVEFAKSWSTFVSKTGQTTENQNAVSGRKALTRLPGLLGLAAAIIVLVGISWLLIRMARLNTELDQFRSERAAQEKRAEDLQQKVSEQSARNEELEKQLADELTLRNEKGSTQVPTQKLLSTIATFILTSGLSRGTDETNKLVIAPNIKLVQMEASFMKADYGSYQATITTIEGGQVWSRGGLKARPRGIGKIVTFTLPARSLNNNDYILTLSGINDKGEKEDISDYPFSVEKK